MQGHNFPDLDKHKRDQELRDRIRAVIRGLVAVSPNHGDRYLLDSTLANLQPIKSVTNAGRVGIGAYFHWDNRIHSNINSKSCCALVVLRQLIINFWNYLLDGSDESLTPDGQIENHLETLEGYADNGLDDFVVVGDERQGFWLMGMGEYRTSIESVR